MTHWQCSLILQVLSIGHILCQYLYTQFEDFYFVQAPGVLLFLVKMNKNYNIFSIFGNPCFNLGDASSAIVRIWLQSACNIKIHKTQTVFEKEWGQLKLRHIKCALLSSTNIYVFLKLIVIMSNCIQSLNHRRHWNYNRYITHIFHLILIWLSETILFYISI